MTKTYRTIVCGTGGVGGGVLREALRLPWIDVVGVQVYSDGKAGVDAGELVAMAPAGVMTTTDPDEIAALDADRVLYCARDLGDWSADDVFVRFLVRGEADAARPLGYGAHHWLVTIEGRPSLRMLLEVNASMESGAVSPQTVVA
jgi:4-hydroxy-tetrahydrodipicolinate reductase